MTRRKDHRSLSCWHRCGTDAVASYYIIRQEQAKSFSSSMESSPRAKNGSNECTVSTTNAHHSFETFLPDSSTLRPSPPPLPPSARARARAYVHAVFYDPPISPVTPRRLCIQPSTSYGAAGGGADGKGTFSPAELAPTSGAAIVAVALGVENEEAMMIPATAPTSPLVRT